MLAIALAIVGIVVGFIGAWLTWRSRCEAREAAPILSSRMADGDLSVRLAFRIGPDGRLVRPPGSLWQQPHHLPEPEAKELIERYRAAYRLTFESGVRAGLARRPRRTPRTDLPGWASLILGAEDAERYRKEWGAHVWELIEEGQSKQARRDRRRLIRSIFWIAVVVRVTRALTRSMI
jgi:hypothetical protein